MAIHNVPSVVASNIYENQIKVTQSNAQSVLSGALDSSKEYFIDGVVDLTGLSVNIEIPQGGLEVKGFSFDTSRIICSDTSYTLFTSPASGSGNLLMADLAIEITGTSSQVYDIVSDTGLEAIEYSRINYNDCTSLGTIDNYRQGLESGTGRFGGTPELTLKGAWVGGYFIETSIVRSLVDGAYSLYKAGAGFTMASRFRSNQNIDLPANVNFFDFSNSNFTNPSTCQLEGCIISRNGVFDATDSNITPNMSNGDLSASWSLNNGITNTFEGGSIGITTSTATTISATSTFYPIAATTWTALDLQHFDNPSAGQLRHLGNTPREYKVVADFTCETQQNNVLKLKINKWDDSASSFISILEQTRQVNSLVGGRDVAFFNININLELDQNDYVQLEISNETATQDVTAETDSYYIIEER